MPLEHPIRANAMQLVGASPSDCPIAKSKAVPNAYVAIAPMSSTWPESFLSVYRMKCMTHVIARRAAAK